ncbi:hypothetical protein [Sphingomicrobium flavum]|nr:hypothetical protein [Sphingomicrobium flavum]
MNIAKVPKDKRMRWERPKLKKLDPADPKTRQLLRRANLHLLPAAK